MTHQALLVEAGQMTMKHWTGFNLINFIRYQPSTNYFVGKTKRELFDLDCNCRSGMGVKTLFYAIADGRYQCATRTSGTTMLPQCDTPLSDSVDIRTRCSLYTAVLGWTIGPRSLLAMFQMKPIRFWCCAFCMDNSWMLLSSLSAISWARWPALDNPVRAFHLN